MSWRDKLQAGRFRTAAFQIDAHDQAGGRRLALHEYPLRDDPYAEDMGRLERILL
jgi:prophage DNA circulation protein